MTTTEVAQYLGLDHRASTLSWLHRHGIHAVSREPGPKGQNLYPTELVRNNRRRRYDRWRDDQGTHIPVGCWVEQVAVHRTQGAARCWLGKHGVVLSRGRGSRVHLRFDGEQQTIAIRPHLVRVLPLSAEHIITQPRDLLPTTGDGDE